MRTRRRHSLALTVSLVGHAVTVLWGLIAFHPTIDIPEITFELTEVELVDPDMLQGLSGEPEAPPKPAQATPEPDPEPPKPDPALEDEKKRLEEQERLRKEAEALAKAEAEKKKKRQEAAKKRRQQRKNFASKGSSADELAPPTSTFNLLLVPKKIRKLPFAGTAFSLLEPWPDFDFLVRKGGLDPLKDFDHIVIASPNITNPLDTFLAVDYKTSRKKVVKAIERAVAAEGEVIEWVDDGGYLRGNPRPADPGKKDRDKRWFVFHPKKKVAMFVREAFLEQVLADDDSPAAKDGTARAFVDNLTKLRRYASEQPLSGMQLKVSDISNAVKRLRLPFPTPDQLEISVAADRDPIVVIRLGFADVVEAKKFEIWFDVELRKVFTGLSVTAIFGSGIYNSSVVSRRDATVTVRSELDQKQIEWVLEQLAEQTKATTEAADRQRAKRERAAKDKLDSGAAAP